MMKSIWTITLASLALLVGCGKKDLDRETALRLLQARTFPTVEGSYTPIQNSTVLVAMRGLTKRTYNLRARVC